MQFHHILPPVPTQALLNALSVQGDDHAAGTDKLPVSRFAVEAPAHAGSLRHSAASQLPKAGPEAPARPREIDALSPAALAARGLAFDCAGTAIVIADADMHIVAANAAYCQLVGVPHQQLAGTLLPLAKPCADLGLCGGCGTPPPGRVCTHGRILCEHRAGHKRSAWMQLMVVTDAAGAVQHHVATFTDLGALEAERDELRHWAQHDALTDLPNRRLFQAELERCMARARRRTQQFGLLFLDLDNFKFINDTLGHDAGDALLKVVACRLRDAVRASDLVARWGGDEFVVALDDLPHPADAAGAASKLQQAITRALDLHGHRLSITASIGIAVFPDHADTPDELLRAADAAMYEAKRLGPGHFAFSAAA